MNKTHYSIQEACDFLGISRQTFWRMEKANEVATFKIGEKRKFVTRKELSRLVNYDLEELTPANK